MALGIAAAQNTLELYDLGYLKNSKSIIEMGSQEIQMHKEDLKQLFDNAGLKSDLIDKYPNMNNYPVRPFCPSKYFYESLGIKEYQSIDINGDHGAIVHDLNKPFEDKSKFNKFDIVTDQGSCEHVFDIAECYRTMHNLSKPGGYIIIAQAVWKGNGYFKFDDSFFEGIAAANSYKVIYNSYILTPINKTKSINGSDYDFHIPRNQIHIPIIMSKIALRIRGRQEGTSCSSRTIILRTSTGQSYFTRFYECKNPCIFSPVRQLMFSQRLNIHF